MQGLGAGEWDVALLGDGSGSCWSRPCGWCCFLADRHQDRVTTFWGGLSSGTVTLSELMPFVQALVWWADQRAPWLRRQLGRPLAGHVITDSQLVAGQGNGALRRKAFRELWCAVDAVEAAGCKLVWHWLPRASTEWSVAADAMARAARVAVGGARGRADGR